MKNVMSLIHEYRTKGDINFLEIILYDNTCFLIQLNEVNINDMTQSIDILTLEKISDRPISIAKEKSDNLLLKNFHSGYSFSLEKNKQAYFIYTAITSFDFFEEEEIVLDTKAIKMIKTIKNNIEAKNVDGQHELSIEKKLIQKV